MRLTFISSFIVIIIAGGLIYSQIRKPDVYTSLPEAFSKLDACVAQEIEIHHYTKDNIVKYLDAIRTACKKEINAANMICPQLSDYISCALAVCNAILGLDYKLPTDPKLER
jgi:hypothetical protein